ncbi:MAG: hypothetical protein ACRCZN_13590 [Lactococcus lactis]
MRRKKAEFARVYENGSEYTKYVIGYKVVNIPRFKRKKKPISLIKALEVRDKMNRKKIFYNSETWEEIRRHHLPENTVLLSEAGGSNIGI